MAKWTRMAVTLCALLLIGIMTTIYTRDVVLLSSFIEPIYSTNGSIIDPLAGLQTRFAQMQQRPGVTIFGDSYSVNNSITWPSQITRRPMQNLAYQGASIDKRYSLSKTLTSQEISELADDLLQQVAKAEYVTREYVFWFGINDLMTIHHWTARERSAAIDAELKTLFAVIDALLNVPGHFVQHVLVPLIIDFSASPGCTMAREANISVEQDVTQATITEWNEKVLAQIKRRRDKLSTIDFYAISQRWFNQYEAYGIKYLINLEDPAEEAYMWADFLHMTPFVHRTLIAPLFEEALLPVAA